MMWTRKPLTPAVTSSSPSSSPVTTKYLPSVKQNRAAVTHTETDAAQDKHQHHLLHVSLWRCETAPVNTLTLSERQTTTENPNKTTEHQRLSFISHNFTSKTRPKHNYHPQLICWLFPWSMATWMFLFFNTNVTFLFMWPFQNANSAFIILTSLCLTAQLHCINANITLIMLTVLFQWC